MDTLEKITKQSPLFDLIVQLVEQTTPETAALLSIEKQSYLLKLAQKIQLPHHPTLKSIHQYLNKLIQIKNTDKNLNCIVQDILSDSVYFEQAGISLGENQWYTLHYSLKKLSIKNNCKTLRFFGIIHTKQKDYFIAEGSLFNYVKDVTLPDQEPRGTGVNQNIYWVTHNLLEDWQELPSVTPQQMSASRFVKYTFSGELNHKIQSYPHFQGEERHLLKCQCVRIANSTYIAPKGLYKTDDENSKEILFEDEFKMSDLPEYANLENWAHVYANVCKIGRTTHYVDPKLDEEEKAKITEQLQTDDPEIDRLRGINEDQQIEMYEAAWIVRTYGDSQQYTKEDATLQYQVLVLKNLYWLGAQTIVNKNGWANIYIGNGQKFYQAGFVPLAPNDILEEPEEEEEQYEPNPKTLPPPPEEPKVDEVQLDENGEPIVD